MLIELLVFFCPQSHELVEDFEFELTPKTKVVYIMREPKAVYASFLRLYNRLSAGHHVLDSTLVAKEFLELSPSVALPLPSVWYACPSSCSHTLTRALIADNGRQGMYFPARLEDDREVPVPFVWNRHVSGWLQYGLQHTSPCPFPFCIFSLVRPWLQSSIHAAVV